MQILIVDPWYPSFLDEHYGGRPDLAESSYDAQWRALMDTYFGTCDSYSHHLAALGVGAREVVANCDPIQEAWARENGLRLPPGLSGRRRQQEILLAQVQAFEPDVVYVQNMPWLLGSTLRRLRPLTRLVVGQIATDPPPARKVALFDLVLTSFPHFVERFRRKGVRSEYLRLAFDPRVLEHLDAEGAEPATRGAVFVGALDRFQHFGGTRMLAQAAARTPLEVWGYRLKGWRRDAPIRRAYRGPAWGLDMYRILRSSRVALNRHVRISGEYANNMRLYEATGAGALLLTDAKRNLGELFVPGVEVVTYRTLDELVSRIAYYLEHESARREIAAAGQRRTLRDHGYDTRMTELADILAHELETPRRPGRARSARDLVAS